MTTATADKLVTVEELAERFGVCDDTIRRLANSGRLPRPVRLGRLYRWRRDVIEAFLSGTQAPADDAT